MRLIDAGYRVWLDTNEMRANPEESMRAGINASSCVLALLNERYGRSRNCLFELTYAVRDARKPVIGCLADSAPHWFLNSALKELLNPQTSFFVDLRPAAAVDWEAAAGVSAADRELLTRSPNAMPKILQLVQDLVPGITLREALPASTAPPSSPSSVYSNF